MTGLGKAFEITAQRQRLSKAQNQGIAEGRRLSEATIRDLSTKLDSSEHLRRSAELRAKKAEQRIREITLRLGFIKASDDDHESLLGVGREYKRLAIHGMHVRLTAQYGKDVLSNTIEGRRIYAFYMAAQTAVTHDSMAGLSLTAMTQRDVINHINAGKEVPQWVIDSLSSATLYFEQMRSNPRETAARAISAIVKKLQSCEFVDNQVMPTFESMEKKFPWTVVQQVLLVRKFFGTSPFVIEFEAREKREFTVPLFYKEDWNSIAENWLTYPK